MTCTQESQRTVRRSASRQGSIYLAVMGVAMIVSIIGMASMQIARLQLKSAGNRQDLEDARLLSQSGVEFGLGNMDFFPNWRTGRAHAVEMTPPLVVGNGTMTYALVDEDSNLTDNTNDPVRLLGIGRVGDAVYATSVLLEAAGGGLTALETSLHSGGDLVIAGSGQITTNQTVSSNANIWGNGSFGVFGNAWAVGQVTGPVTGTKNIRQSPPKEMPDPATVFDYYVANGTQIAYSDTGGSIDKQLISPASNPFGSSTNPLGIYVIDCGGSDIVIKDCRILGTLVLLNAGSASNIDMDIHWESAVWNYPALMVEGDLEMKWHGNHNLRESQHNMSFNPTGTPYQGTEDTDEVDEYPPLIKGLVYVSGNLAITKECHLEGVVVVGGATGVDDILTLTYDSAFLNNPPPGFSTGTVMQIVPGTWRRDAYYVPMRGSR